MLLSVSLLSSGWSSFAVLFGHFSTLFYKFHFETLPSGQLLSSHIACELNTISCQELFILKSCGPGKQILPWHHLPSQLFPPCIWLSLPSLQPPIGKGVKKQHVLFPLFSFFNLLLRTWKSLKIHMRFAQSTSLDLTLASRKVKVNAFDVFWKTFYFCVPLDIYPRELRSLSCQPYFQSSASTEVESNLL